MGAGIIECDVTFTKDLELVCRHSQCDLATSTNILQTEMANTCRQPFTPAQQGAPASAQCCTSDITLAEFKTLCARPDVKNSQATSVAEFLAPLDSPVIDQPNQCGTVMSHRDSIELIRDLGTAFTPELKRPEVLCHSMAQPAGLCQKITDRIPSGRHTNKTGLPQSFNINDVRYWIENHPQYAQQTIWLVPRERQLGHSLSRVAVFAGGGLTYNCTADTYVGATKLEGAGRTHRFCQSREGVGTEDNHVDV